MCRVMYVRSAYQYVARVPAYRGVRPPSMSAHMCPSSGTVVHASHVGVLPSAHVGAWPPRREPSRHVTP